jgi:hypothetical protein
MLMKFVNLLKIICQESVETLGLSVKFVFWPKSLFCVEKDWKRRLTATHCYLSGRPSIDPIRYRSWKLQGLTSSLAVS